MAQHYDNQEWQHITHALLRRGTEFGLPPANRGNSIYLALFNIRKLGRLTDDDGKPTRSAGAWKFLATVCKRFDFIAVQEVLGDTSGLMHLHRKLGPRYIVTYSDITGATPEKLGTAKRLAFLYRPDKVQRMEMSGDIAFDRTYVQNEILANRESISKNLDKYGKELKKFKRRHRKTRPVLTLSNFPTFNRQPHLNAFRVHGRDGAAHYEFIAVNAHLVYRQTIRGRRQVFRALIDWLCGRAAALDTMPVKNLILLGDLNFHFEKPRTQRPKYDALLRGLNAELKAAGGGAEFYLPFIDKHTATRKFIRTNARRNQTYDQIAIVRHDLCVPGASARRQAGPGGPFDYGYFDFVRLFRETVFANGGFRYAKFEYDVSDHMPIWMRLEKPRPGLPEIPLSAPAPES